MKQITINVQTRKMFNVILDVIQKKNVWVKDGKMKICIECEEGEYLRFFTSPKKAYEHLSEFMTQDAIDSFVIKREMKGASGVVWRDWFTGKPQIHIEYKT